MPILTRTLRTLFFFSRCRRPVIRVRVSLPGELLFLCENTLCLCVSYEEHAENLRATLPDR